MSGFERITKIFYLIDYSLLPHFLVNFPMNSIHVFPVKFCQEQVENKRFLVNLMIGTKTCLAVLSCYATFFFFDDGTVSSFSSKCVDNDLNVLLENTSKNLSN